MEVEVITSFSPDLVTAVSGCVKSVAHKCLAKGLIHEYVYERVLELGEATSKDKARTLLQAVTKSIETDERCFELFLSILEEELPFAVRDRLLNDIRKEAANPVTAVVPSTKKIQQIPRGELSRECAIQQRTLLEKLEEAIRRHQIACDEKKHSEERLKVKTDECKELKRVLENQTQKSSTELDNAKSKISTCESELENLKARVKELQSTIEEQDMQTRRGRNDMIMKTRQTFAIIAQESHTAGQEKAMKEMEMRDREYKLTIQEKDLEILKLKEESKRDSSDSPNAVPEDALTPENVKYLEDCLRTSNAIQKQELHNSMQWHKDLALRLGFTDEEYDKIFGNKKCTCSPEYRQISDSGHDYNCILHCVFIRIEIHNIIAEWVKWYPGDSRGTTSFPTYSRLKMALVDQGFGDIARELPRDISGLSVKP